MSARAARRRRRTAPVQGPAGSCLLPRVSLRCRLAEGAQPEVLLTCKALWEAGRGVLHSCARVARPGGQAPAPAAAYIEPLQQHRGTLQHLELDVMSWPAGASIAACVAAVDPARLRGLTIYASPTTFAEAQLQLPAFSALETLDLNVGQEGAAAALPPSLRRLSMHCCRADAGLAARLTPLTRLRTLRIECWDIDPGVQLPAVHTLQLRISGSSDEPEPVALPALSASDVRIAGALQDIGDGPFCLQLSGSGELLGASSGRLTRLVLTGWGLEEPPAALGCPGLQVMELGQVSCRMRVGWVQRCTARATCKL